MANGGGGARAGVAVAMAAGLYLGAQANLGHAGHGDPFAAVLNSLSAGHLPKGGGPGANRALGKTMAAASYKWTGTQWHCLNVLWTGESGWDTYNTYPSHDTPASTPGADITTAYGIPQALPAQKMASAGPDWQTSAETQIKWGLGYIHHTYRTPCNALAFKRAHGNKGY